MTEEFTAAIEAARAAHIALGNAIELLPAEVAKLQQEAQARADEIVASAAGRADETIANATKEAARLRDEAEREVQALHAMHADKRSETHRLIIRNEDLELKAIALQTKADEAHAEHARITQLMADTRAKLFGELSAETQAQFKELA